MLMNVVNLAPYYCIIDVLVINPPSQSIYPFLKVCLRRILSQIFPCFSGLGSSISLLKIESPENTNLLDTNLLDPTENLKPLDPDDKKSAWKCLLCLRPRIFAKFSRYYYCRFFFIFLLLLLVIFRFQLRY